MTSRPLHICVIAGEASGDALGARLIRALKASGRDIRFTGIGGGAMTGEGLQSLFPITDLSVMGVAEVLPRLPLLLRRIAQTADHIVTSAPDIVVTIDSPDFTARVVREAQKRMGDVCPKFIHYVAPTVWAWRPERAAKMAAIYDGIICLFPFEPPYFEREGMRAAFVGHSMIEDLGNMPTRADARRVLHIPENKKVLGLFFGSRMGELNRMGPVLRDAAIRYAQDNPGLQVVSVTLPHLEREVRALLLQMPCDVQVISDPAHKKHGFAALDLALATSGTVGLELGVAGVPHVIGYKTSFLTYHLIKNKIKVRFAHLVNLLLDRAAVPEFLQNDCTAQNIYRGISGINASAQKDAFAQARAQLSGQEKNPPSRQAADFILSFIN